MDGKEDLHHNQGEVEHEEYASEEDDESFYDFDFFEEHHKKKIYVCTVLREEDIWQRQEEEIERLCSNLSISKDEAIILLLHFGWDSKRVIDQWLVEEEYIRGELELLLGTRVLVGSPNSLGFCGLCSYSNYNLLGTRVLVVGANSPMVCGVCSYSNFLDRQYLVRSYVESKREIKWCPAPHGCEYAVEVGSYGSESGSYEVTCECCHEFCWNCLKEAHSPVDCEILRKWMLRSSEDDEAVEMYNHYFERWAFNESCRRRALSDMQSIQNFGLEKLRISQYLSDHELQFVTDAWLQIVNCRRVLKWTYAYGYCLAQSEHAKDLANKKILEYLQAYAESSLGQLHECADQELKGFISQEMSQTRFS